MNPKAEAALATVDDVDSAQVVWTVNLSDTDSRTMTADEIVTNWRSGLVTADAFIWKDGMTDWVPILDSELSRRLNGPAAPASVPPPPAAVLAPAGGRWSSPGSRPASAPAPAPGSAPAASAARRSGDRSQLAQDLFGAVDVAGSEEEQVATSAPSVPPPPGFLNAQAADDAKLTGARNENSVLFSLDALKAGFSHAPVPSVPGRTKSVVPPPPSKSNRPAAPSNADDPFAMSSAELLGLGGSSAGALYGMADNQALLTAPARPVPVPVVVKPESERVSSAEKALVAAKRTRDILIGALSGIVVMGIGLVYILTRHSPPVPTPTTSVAAETKPSGPGASGQAKPEEPKPEDKAATKPDEKVAAKPDEKPSEEKKDESKSASDAAKKKTVVTGPVVAKPKAEEAPAGDGAFSRSAAISALSTAASAAQSCKKPGGPTGGGKVSLTFAVSGRVTTATVSGPPFAGTPVGGCVASVFRRAKVPPFSGNPVTVTKSFQIN